MDENNIIMGFGLLTGLFFGWLGGYWHGRTDEVKRRLRTQLERLEGHAAPH